METQEAKPLEPSLTDIATRLEQAGMYGIAADLRLLIPKYVRVEDKPAAPPPLAEPPPTLPRITRRVTLPDR